MRRNKVFDRLLDEVLENKKWPEIDEELSLRFCQYVGCRYNCESLFEVVEQCPYFDTWKIRWKRKDQELKEYNYSIIIRSYNPKMYFFRRYKSFTWNFWTQGEQCHRSRITINYNCLKNIIDRLLDVIKEEEIEFSYVLSKFNLNLDLAWLYDGKDEIKLKPLKEPLFFLTLYKQKSGKNYVKVDFYNHKTIPKIIETVNKIIDNFNLLKKTIKYHIMMS